MDRACWTVLLLTASTVAGQFYVIPQLSSLFPMQQFSTYQDLTTRNQEFNVISRRNQRTTTRRPDNYNIYVDTSTSRADSYNYNYNSRTTKSPFHESTSNRSQEQRHITKRPLSLGSFIDVSMYRCIDVSMYRCIDVPSEDGYFKEEDENSSPNYNRQDNFDGRLTTKRPSNSRPPISSSFGNTPQSSSFENSRPISNKRPSDVSFEKSNQGNEYSFDYKTTRRPQKNHRPSTSRPNYYDYTKPDSNVDQSNIRPSQDQHIIRPNINEYDSRPQYETTKIPNFARPGVLKPNVDENRAPITNKPPNLGGNTVQSGTDFVFPSDNDVEPELITGPDDAYMTADRKRRAVELSERMCERYKAANTEHFSAIPLVPLPLPVDVDVARCAPVNVPLVVGGQVVNIEQYPHMAALGWKKLQGGGYSWKCGGSLVSERYVLTAAHCSYQDRDNTVVQGPPRAVQLGSERLGEPGATLVTVAAAIRHPRYKPPASYHDVALLRLTSKVSFSEKIRPACLGEPPRPGEAVIATGWGRTEFGGETSQELRGVSLPVWDMDECTEALGTSRKLPQGPSRESQICAGESKGGKDTCQGDSGGPAQVGDSCLWRVVGVTSLGRACGAPRTPALYARATRAFIASVIWL